MLTVSKFLQKSVKIVKIIPSTINKFAILFLFFACRHEVIFNAENIDFITFNAFIDAPSRFYSVLKSLEYELL